jgi:acyl-coenzyme A synthetase/AMP-(fatty) acid ligase
MGRWTQTSGWSALDATNASLLIANPTLLREVLTETQARGRAPGRLRAVLSGGGPVPPALKRAFRDELRLPLVESFGQSELGGFMALGFPELVSDDALLGRVGPALPDKEVRIVDPISRAAAPPGRIGEIELRGGFMSGYWGKPDKTAETIGSGWLRTGDLGMIDRDGYITMRGRRSELIETDGVLWFPRDVEEAFCTIDGVALAALVGVADATHGQRPYAFITTLPGASLEPEALKSAVAGKVPYDITPLVVRLVTDLPMTPTGKIAKGELAARLSAGA